jgi:hypothetical protein
VSRIIAAVDLSDDSPDRNRTNIEREGENQHRHHGPQHEHQEWSDDDESSFFSQRHLIEVVHATDHSPEVWERGAEMQSGSGTFSTPIAFSDRTSDLT